MSLWIPDPREREVLQFHLARSLPYRPRIAMVIVLLLVGVAFQALIPLPWAYAGVLLLLAAGILMSTAGYSNVPAKKKGRGFWKNAPIRQLDTILKIVLKSKSWDVSALDVTNGIGLMAGLGICVLTIVFAVVAEGLSPGAFGLVALSGVALFAPIWLTGLRLTHSNRRIEKQVTVLQEVLAFFKVVARPDEIVEASLFLNGPEKDAVPQDVRLQFRWKEASDQFYGMQCQVNLNHIQGALYPYCYVVLVAKRGLDIAGMASDLGRPGCVTVETKAQNDVNVIVIRQHTTKTSGYETKTLTHRELLARGLTAGRRIAAKYPR